MRSATREEDKDAANKLKEQVLREDAEDNIMGSVVSKTLDELSKELEKYPSLFLCEMLSARTRQFTIVNMSRSLRIECVKSFLLEKLLGSKKCVESMRW